MATIGTAVTYLDLQRRMEKNGRIARIIELLAQQNEILQDMRVLEANEGTKHTTTVRTGLPSATWRKLNYGVQPSKSVTSQVTDTCGMLESYAKIDVDLAKINGNNPEWRMSEEIGFREKMNQDMSTALFYGDQTVYPERFTGLAPRFNVISTDSTKSGYNVIDGAGAGSINTSMWLVAWGDTTVHGIFPKGSEAGLVVEDLGSQLVTDDAGGNYQAFVTHYQWKVGLCVRDWRYVVRIANIEVNATTEAIAADLIPLMVKATHRLPSQNIGGLVWYCNKQVLANLDTQTMAKSNLHLTYSDIQGIPVVKFRGVPIRRCDAILNTEAHVA